MMRRKIKFYYCANCGLDRDNDKKKSCKKCKRWTINQGEREIDDSSCRFFCRKCNKPTNEKTHNTKCLICNEPLERIGHGMGE